MFLSQSLVLLTLHLDLQILLELLFAYDVREGSELEKPEPTLRLGQISVDYSEGSREKAVSLSGALEAAMGFKAQRERQDGLSCWVGSRV